MYLRPKEIAQVMGTSNNFVNKLIHKCKPPEQRDTKTGKMLFDIDAIIKFIQIAGR